MSATIRTFIGVPISVPPTLAAVCQDIAALGRVVKPVEDATMHITLKYLGETPRDQIDRIAEILSDHAAQISARTIAVRGLNGFPNRQRPAIIWAALEDAADLVTLSVSLESALEPEGFAREGRAYTPHLTLARVRAIKGESRLEIPEGVMNLMAQHADTEFGEVRMSEVVLYESVLDETGPTYTQLASVDLG